MCTVQYIWKIQLSVCQHLFDNNVIIVPSNTHKIMMRTVFTFTIYSFTFHSRNQLNQSISTNNQLNLTSLTHIHSLTHSLTHSTTASLTHSLTLALSHTHTQPTKVLAGVPSRCVPTVWAHARTHSLTHSLTRSLTYAKAH